VFPQDARILHRHLETTEGNQLRAGADVFGVERRAFIQWRPTT